MNVSLIFIRSFFTLLSILFVTLYSLHTFPIETGLFIGIFGGLCLGLFFIALEIFFKRFNLRAFNIALIGLFFGYLMGRVLVVILHGLLSIFLPADLHTQFIELTEVCIFLFAAYLGLILTLRASDELYISIPFVKFSPLRQKSRDLLMDASVLADSRIVDLALSGLLDQQLVIPRFLIRDLYAQIETADLHQKEKAKRSLETLKKLEDYAELGVRFNDTDFPEVKDIPTKLLRLARLIDANLLTADLSRIQTSSIEGIRVINIHALSNALKPLSETGEVLKVKIQRIGKEPNQGIGYLEDGTMIVVNGGGEFIGQTVSAAVLSVKQTSSGRMIFCNVLEEDYRDMPKEES